MPPPRALRRRRRQEDLGRVGQHLGPDVAPDHDEVAPFRDPLLLRHQSVTHGRDLRDHGDCPLHFGCPQRCCHVAAVRVHLRGTAGARHHADLGPCGKLPEGCPIAWVDAAPQRNERQRPVHQTGVHEPVAEPSRELTPHGRLAGGHRAVDRDHARSGHGGMLRCAANRRQGPRRHPRNALIPRFRHEAADPSETTTGSNCFDLNPQK